MPQSTTSPLEKLKSHCAIRERSPNPVAKVEGLAYFVLQRPAPEKAAKFFLDFGLLLDQHWQDSVYLRGSSDLHHMVVIERGSPRFARVGLKASAESVQALAQRFSVPLQKRSGPMGGTYVSLEDPNGLTIEVNYGLSTLPTVEKKSEIPWNTSEDKPRINSTVRKVVAPPTVHKLGHTVHSVRNMQETVHWYQDTFGLIVSDFQFLPDDPNPTVAFMRCDLGDTPCDHHTIAVALTPELGHAHTAFEVDSMEDIAIGKEWMEINKHKHSWGIGRHILGSQIFDYWRDTDGDMFEHYADGDLFNADVPTGYHPFNRSAQHQWGPEMTHNFAGTDKPWQLLKSVVKRLPSDDELNFDKLKRLSKAMKPVAQ